MGARGHGFNSRTAPTIFFLPVLLRSHKRSATGAGAELSARFTEQAEPRKRSSAKIGTIQRRLAWPLRKDDTQIREAFHIFSTFNFPVHFPQNSILLKREKIRGEDTSEHRKAGKCWVLRRILQREASAIESQLICGESKSPCGLMDKALDF